MLTQQVIPIPVGSPQRDPLEIFVGNLSYFCEENDLYELFNSYSTVTNVRVMRANPEQRRPLLYGFIMLTSRPEVEEMCRLFNGHLFMGRHLRVEPSDGAPVQQIDYVFPSPRNSYQQPANHDISGNNTSSRLRSSFQIHVAISSSFMVTQIIKPTEILLRKFFIRIGSVLDVQVNWYSTGTPPMFNRQEGYAFVSFATYETYEQVLRQQVFQIDGITLVCTKSKGGFRHVAAASSAHTSTTQTHHSFSDGRILHHSLPSMSSSLQSSTSHSFSQQLPSSQLHPALSPFRSNLSHLSPDYYGNPTGMTLPPPTLTHSSSSSRSINTPRLQFNNDEAVDGISWNPSTSNDCSR